MLNILNSDWLIHMLKKAGSTPQKRLLSLFIILDDWSGAPGVASQYQLDMQLPAANTLQAYLSSEAEKAGAALPEMLASQLYFMALSATVEKVQGSNQQSLTHARNAAKALIAAQTKKEFHIAKSSVYAIAASVVGAIVITGGLLLHTQPKITETSQLAFLEPQAKVISAEPVAIANPLQTAALVAQIEQMRKGNCQLIEAIQLPDSYKKVYFENIVLGQISTNVDDQKLVRELLQKVRCNYTPMLMANSTG